MSISKRLNIYPLTAQAPHCYTNCHKYDHKLSGETGVSPSSKDSFDRKCEYDLFKRNWY